MVVRIGDDRDNTLIGTPQRDVILGGPGGDIIQGRGGNDLLVGQEGDNTIRGQRGDDLIIGGNTGEDSLFGGPGRDRFIFQSADDISSKGGAINDDIFDFDARQPGGDRIDFSRIDAFFDPDDDRDQPFTFDPNAGRNPDNGEIGVSPALPGEEIIDGGNSFIVTIQIGGVGQDDNVRQLTVNVIDGTLNQNDFIL